MSDDISELYINNRADMNRMATPSWRALKDAGEDPGLELTGRPFFKDRQYWDYPDSRQTVGIHQDDSAEVLFDEGADNSDWMPAGATEPVVSQFSTRKPPFEGAPAAALAAAGQGVKPPFEGTPAAALAAAGQGATGGKDEFKGPGGMVYRRGGMPITFSGPTKDERPDDIGMIPRAIVRGAGDALNNTWGLAEMTADFLDLEAPEFLKARLPIPPPGDDKAENAIRGITQFLVPFAAVGKIGAAFKLYRDAKAGKGLTEVAAYTLQGALADFIAFDPATGNFNSFIQTTSWKNPLSDFLSYKTGEEELYGRLKNTVEGAFLGASLDMVILAARTIRRGVQIRREAQAVVDEAERARSGGADTPADASVELSAKGDSSTSNTVNVEGSQDLDSGSQRSVNTSPDSGSVESFAKPKSPSRTQYSSGSDAGIDGPPRGSYQKTDDVATLSARASELEPEFSEQLRLVSGDIDGVQFLNTRVKELDAVNEKAASIGAANLNDYLGGRLIVDNKKALDALLARIRERFDVHSVDNMLEDTTRPERAAARSGYKAVHISVRTNQGFVAEIQVQPYLIAEINERFHEVYKRWGRRAVDRRLTPAEYDQLARERSEMRRAYERAHLQWVRENEPARASKRAKAAAVVIGIGALGGAEAMTRAATMRGVSRSKGQAVAETEEIGTESGGPPVSEEPEQLSIPY